MDNIVCTKCNLSLEMIKSSFDYLGYHFSEKVLRCPKCELMYIPEELVDGKITQMETALEDK